MHVGEWYVVRMGALATGTEAGVVMKSRLLSCLMPLCAACLCVGSTFADAQYQYRAGLSGGLYDLDDGEEAVIGAFAVAAWQPISLTQDRPWLLEPYFGRHMQMGVSVIDVEVDDVQQQRGSRILDAFDYDALSVDLFIANANVPVYLNIAYEEIGDISYAFTNGDVVTTPDIETLSYEVGFFVSPDWSVYGYVEDTSDSDSDVFGLGTSKLWTLPNGRFIQGRANYRYFYEEAIDINVLPGGLLTRFRIAASFLETYSVGMRYFPAVDRWVGIVFGLTEDRVGNESATFAVLEGGRDVGARWRISANYRIERNDIPGYFADADGGSVGVELRF